MGRALSLRQPRRLELAQPVEPTRREVEQEGVGVGAASDRLVDPVRRAHALDEVDDGGGRDRVRRTVTRRGRVGRHQSVRTLNGSWPRRMRRAFAAALWRISWYAALE